MDPTRKSKEKKKDKNSKIKSDSVAHLSDEQREEMRKKMNEQLVQLLKNYTKEELLDAIKNS